MQRAATEVQAANGALRHIGEPALASLDEPRAAARACKPAFPDVRDALLREADWNFATAWAVPACLPGPAIGPLKKRYAMPADCVGVRYIDGLTEDDWAVEDAALLPGQPAPEAIIVVTNATAPRICYTRRIENVALWDALFLDVFQLRLGAAIAPGIGRSRAIAVELEARATARLKPAKRRDAREKARTAVTRETSWISARRSYRGRWS